MTNFQLKKSKTIFWIYGLINSKLGDFKQTFGDRFMLVLLSLWEHTDTLYPLNVVWTKNIRILLSFNNFDILFPCNKICVTNAK